MRKAVGPLAAFFLGMVAIATVLFAPVWARTTETFCCYFPPPGEKEWKIPPGTKIGYFKEVQRGPFWEASRCLGCARWTAAVFHLMRVMEGVLRVLTAVTSRTPTSGSTPRASSELSARSLSN